MSFFFEKSARGDIMVFLNKTPDYCAIDNDVQFQLNDFDESLRYCNLNT